MHAGHFVRVTASGAVTAVEQFAAIRAAAPPRSRLGARILFDARDMTARAELPADEELQDYSRRIASLGYRRFAIVVDRERVEVSVRFAAYCAQIGVAARVFGDLAPAKRWLVGDLPVRPTAA
jgi:hypothetical protein